MYTLKLIGYCLWDGSLIAEDFIEVHRTRKQAIDRRNELHSSPPNTDTKFKIVRVSMSVHLDSRPKRARGV